MDSILETISNLVDYVIADDDKYSDEDIFQLGARLERLSKDCFDSIDYGSD
jgi:hypothetical protein